MSYKSGNEFDQEVMPSAHSARREDRRERRALPLYVLICLLLGAAILGITLLVP